MTSPTPTDPNKNAPELSALYNEERELRERLAVVTAKREVAEAKLREDAAEQERNKTVTALVEKIDGGQVLVKLEPYREDAVSILRATPSRIYTAPYNRIAIEYWEACANNLRKLPNLTIAFSNGSKLALENALSAPDYAISLTPDDKFIKIAITRADAYVISRLPGAAFRRATQAHDEYWTVPISEGWRLHDALKNQEKVVWDDRALKIILSDMEKRARLDEIALKHESPEVRALVKFASNDLVLRPFQEVGIEFIDAAGGRALLADQMGLGKTWQGLGYALLRNLRSCIVCPASLKANWAREIKRLTGESAYIMSGSEPTKHDVRRLLIDKPRFAIINYDILSRKTETYNEKAFKETGLKSEVQTHFVWAELINLAQFDLVIADECHYAKNSEAARTQALMTLSAPRFIGATGTPVMNRPGELWPILSTLYPEKFPSEDRFIATYTFNNKEARNVEELRELLKPIMIRRLKKDVVKELPPINRIYEWRELSPKARALCEKIMKGIFEALEEWGGSGEPKAIANLLVQIMRLKQVVAIDKIQTVADLGVEVVDALSENENIDARKCLIFSQFKPVTRAIAARLGNEAVCINGDLNMSQRQALIDQFKSDSKIKFLVATSAVASEGLNLQEAGAVIFTDLLWTPAAHEQCEGRAYGRLAALHSIDSYYVVAENSIDQWIQEILDRKMRVIDQVVEGLDSERNASVAMELLRKMKEELRR